VRVGSLLDAMSRWTSSVERNLWGRFNVLSGMPGFVVGSSRRDLPPTAGPSCCSVDFYCFSYTCSVFTSFPSIFALVYTVTVFPSFEMTVVTVPTFAPPFFKTPAIL
jgi:hypothetical protein